MDGSAQTVSAAAMGVGHWDAFEAMPGGHGGVSRATRDGRSYVVKTYAKASAGAARERAALSALEGAAGTPRLLAEFDDPPGVVMEHLDGSTSVADALLGPDPRAATGALTAWGEALARLHAAGDRRVQDRFERALGVGAPAQPPRMLGHILDTAATQYGSVLADLGLPAHRAGLDELRHLPAALSRGHDVLSPADTCPDNNVVVGDTVILLDFEHAEIRHRAWDVGYLRAPWPSCWCAWLLPHEVAAAAVESYCRIAGIADTDPTFEPDVATATAGWQAVTPAWFTAGALATDDRAHPPWRPSRRAFVLHRLDAVSRNPALPALAAMAADLHQVLCGRWGDIVLDLAPAFR